MNLYEIIRTLYYNWKVILLITVLPPAIVYFLTGSMEKKYQSSAMIYTGIASGYNIESGDGSKMDNHVVNNAFDNLITLIKSRETLEEVGLRLLADHLMKKTPDYQLSAKAFQALEQEFPMNQREWVDDSDLDITLSRLYRKYQEGDPVIVKTIIDAAGPYSVKSLSKLEAQRVKSSDMVILAYQYTDPAITQASLNILLDVFIERYKNLKGSETTNVVGYFERRLAEIKEKLTAAEDRLTDFRSKNRVINYGEQTKAIANKKQDALDEYSKSKMNRAATQAAIEKIEEKLKIRESVLSKNAALLDKKHELSDITSRIALIETAENQEELSELIDRQSALKKEISEDLHQLFNFSNSKEGLPTRQLLDDWLNNIVNFQREEVLVKLYSDRLAELNQQYDRFAPLGSTIDRYEREIDVYEREFLEVLHGLNMAKIKQQNIELSSSLNVLDRAKFPTRPMSSKRLLLVIASFMAGLSLSVGGILLTELLDTSLRNPERAKTLTELETCGAFPMIRSNQETQIDSVLPQLLNQMVDSIHQKTKQVEGQPKLVIVSSAVPITGKSFTIQRLNEALTKKNKSTLTASYQELEGVAVYDESELIHAQYIEDLIDTKDLEKQDFILLEIPALILGNVPYDLIQSAHMHLMVERADRGWSSGHQRAMTALKTEVKEVPTQLILNSIKPRLLENIVGPSLSTNSFKSFFKRLLRFEFSKSSLAK